MEILDRSCWSQICIPAQRDFVDVVEDMDVVDCSFCEQITTAKPVSFILNKEYLNDSHFGIRLPGYHLFKACCEQSNDEKSNSKV